MMFTGESVRAKGPDWELIPRAGRPSRLDGGHPVYTLRGARTSGTRNAYGVR